MPSCHTNAKYDYIPPPADLGFTKDPPADDVWPVSPPRIDLYVNATALIHPLVSPLAVKAEDWRGAPPVYMCTGNEALEDEIAIVARRMHGAGVEVVFDGYEGMPHCFGMIFPQHAAGKECMGSWGRFIKDAVEGRFEEGSGKVSWAKAFSNPVRKEEMEFGELKKELGDEEVERLLRAKRERRVEKEERMVREWREQQQQQQQHPSLPHRLRISQSRNYDVSHKLIDRL